MSSFKHKYRMPAEWESHESTWLTWPVNKITWPGRLLKEVQAIYLRMMGFLLSGEKVNLLVPDEKTGGQVLHFLETKKAVSKNLLLHKVPAVDSWIRDYGPIFLRRRAFAKFIFNAWGGKYEDLARDNGVVGRVSALKKFKRLDIPLVLEGGSIDVNGKGVCLTTEQCLLNPNRNPKMSRKQIEEKLGQFLGIEKFIWLNRGIEGDDTDGHVDDIARFVNPDTILTATEPDKNDENHDLLAENLKRLKFARTLEGKRFKIVELPMPGPVTSPGGRLPASYANFYIANRGVLVPVYSHSHDKKALRIIRGLFPGKKIEGIECTALVHGLGSIHCVTQQEPMR